MDKKSTALTVFIIVALLQLALPGKMIWDNEKVLETGKEYKFKTAPIDPSDPFRGKYITLQYKENTTEVDDIENWSAGEDVYVTLKTDSQGFAKIDFISKVKPKESDDFVTAKVGFVWGNHLKSLNIEYPFNRFYMEETKAPEAERAYRKAQLATSQVTYALVSIKNGQAVLKDVLINGVPIGKIVKKNRAGNR